MKYAKVNIKPQQKIQFDRICESMINRGDATDKIEVFQKLLDTFDSKENKLKVNSKKPYTSEEKLDIFTGLVYAHNLTESKKKPGDRNYINIPSIGFIATETGLNAARLDKDAKEASLKKMQEQARRLKFDGSENNNPVVDERVEVHLKKRKVARRAIIVEILKNSEYHELFGY